MKKKTKWKMQQQRAIEVKTKGLFTNAELFDKKNTK